MNIFGNAQKYTQSGYIMLQLGVNESHNNETGNISNHLSLHIRDTGKGMSSEYMERKLYHPFAQEDTFATGVGLGLSIV
jgi:signal transduction histidine kinase